MKSKRAPKSKPLTPVFDKKRDKWRLSVPASAAPDGKRQQLFFPSERAALMEVERLNGMAKRWGSEGRKITASLAEDAARASALLAGHEITLTELARRHIEKIQRESESQNFGDVWQLFAESREGKSDEHKRGIEKIGEKVTARIGGKLVCNLSHSEVREALRADFRTPHYFNRALRTVSPAFNFAVREGWAKSNPCNQIEKIDTGRRKVEVLTVNQCRKLMSACVDYRENEKMPELLKVDCRECLPAVAIMLFAGVRPTETSRLDWSDVDLSEGTILVSNQKAKTDRSRYFTMPETLRAWLESVPATERTGSIVPSAWRRKIQAVRKAAKISDGQDQLRKTFASMHLAHFGDVNLTRSIMGHEQGDVLFQHYRGLVKPKDAASFWQILPTGTEIELLEKATA